MDIRPFDLATLPSPWREVSQREVNNLSAMSDVLAVGVCGSLAYGDVWPGSDPYSALAWITTVSMSLAEIFTLLAGVNRTHRRVVSRLEKATTRLQRSDVFQSYIALLGFPRTLDRTSELLSELQWGYREIWNYFKGKPDGPVYMVQQPDSEAWFKNRIVPLYNYDRRDLVSLVYAEFRFILALIYNVAGYERTPDMVFREAAKFQGPPSRWVERYKNILRYFSTDQVPGLLGSAKDLIREGRSLANERPWKHIGQ